MVGLPAEAVQKVAHMVAMEVASFEAVQVMEMRALGAPFQVSAVATMAELMAMVAARVATAAVCRVAGLAISHRAIRLGPGWLLSQVCVVSAPWSSH